MWRFRLFVVVAAAGMLCVGVLGLSVYCLQRASRVVDSTSNMLNEPVSFLSDELAVKAALDALRLHGGGPWEPVEHRRSEPPNGGDNTYLNRNLENPNMGTILFVAKSNRQRRAVRVTLVGNTIKCDVWVTK